MVKLTARERLAAGDPPAVYTLDDAKAARLKGRTMLIPSPMQVRDAIAAIPVGQSKTFGQLRADLARDSGADVTCPFAAGVFWRVVAEAAEEDRAEGATEVTPWWRVTRDGKPNPKLPGGESRHRELLGEEGIKI
ncbi:MGMT family protein [Fimbriimonas ginsengisoli]|uniref:Uncharacterized protein n=1 Tax=Fimbriimonas ginsengisoli Gsoil 348 TaxID=661478 RepID=A0A068NKP3_FIMGI|nr:MGMT family protein [Fimbriimonas ginsengisoli]AIE84002.1 hypothetical protein OP10G_0634 [Fimbriimonas ginsengisoli Gsoil 348]